MRSRHAQVFLACIVAGASLGAAGCGSGAGPPGVASLGGSAGTTSSTAPPNDSAPSLSPGGDNGVAVMIAGGRNALEFSRCMRAHGVSSVPDPNAQGAIQVTVDPSSATFRSARRACQPLIGGGTKRPQLSLEERRQALAFSACIRTHGVPDFPDPNFSGGGVRISIQGKPGSEAAMQAAQDACKAKLPAGFGAKLP